MVTRINANRPRLLAAAFASRDFEIDRLKFEEEERNGVSNHRVDLLEFASFVLLAELCGQRIAVGPSRQPFTLALVAFGQKYHDPRLLRDLAHLARSGAPL